MFSYETMIAFFNTFIERKYYMTLLSGIQETLLMTAIATVIGLIIGIFVAIIQVSEFPRKLKWLEKILKGIAKLYVDIIRGTPAIVQVSFIWLVVLADVVMARPVVGGISFGINSGAYMAELIRAGIQGIDKGQMEAGRSLGLSYFQTMKLIIIPQAFRQMLPALVSEFIVLIKETAVIGMIGGRDIMRAGNIMMSDTGSFIWPILIVTITYLVLTSTFTMIMRVIEKRMNKGRF
ncbi:MAG: amino acid ABC transporter permease [Zhenhengia sp.]|jgi:His/Glu/Gln/Arg/opine family amino acid ABC transporter permease subunit|uniref:Amino acid ABC transporter permease n=1 Tax=Zhenhengia yiwuensis TaxID=2763666 RepID=A0A926EJN4_9FIRM|nr:amino acid ABC transporter permease [Zhenhengia yiwuensis]MBC8579612.1 amino acid ABC transporter permease [Zhenhengia yiwuensis]MBS5315142.1 amino acid ABC transporter permease [Clostridiales bacterium]MBS5800802.1 amino acid ABC transporter permease [Clostridiales bacterium]MDY3369689.1 amino acid ABC transporter permease [Zhenhengia yiwuensis]